MTCKGSPVKVNALAIVYARAMTDDTLDAKSTLEYLTIDLKSLLTLVSNDNARAIRADEDVPIAELDAQHVGLILC